MDWQNAGALHCGPSGLRSRWHLLRKQTSDGISVDGLGGAELLVDLHEGLGGEGVGTAESGEEDGGGEGDEDGGDAAEDDCGNGSPPAGGEAAFELAELVGGADEEPVDGADAAAHLGRGGELEHAGAYDDGDHVAGSRDDERYEAKPEIAREAEDDGGDAEDGHADEHGGSGAALDGARHEQQRDDEGADAGHGSEEAEAARTGVQDISGKDGEQRDGAAEHDGEEVEGDGAEQELGAPDVLEAGEQGAGAEGGGLALDGIGADHADEDDEAGEHQEGEDVDDGGSAQWEKDAGEGQGEEQATDGWSGHICDLVDGGSPGDGIDEVILGDEAGEQGTGGGSAEGPAHADADQDSVDGPDTVSGEGPRGEGEPEQHGGADCLETVAEQDDSAAVVTVGGVPGGEHEDEAGEEEREAGQAEVECGVRDLVNLPGDGDRLSFGADDCHEPCTLVETEVAGAKGVARAGGQSTVTISHSSMLSHFRAHGPGEPRSGEAGRDASGRLRARDCARAGNLMGDFDHRRGM